MSDYNAFQDYKESKRFESYLIIKNRIVDECKKGIQEILAELDKAYNTDEDLMIVLQGVLRK